MITFNDLPYEMKMKIGTYLDFHTAASYSVTCKNIRKIIDDGYFWKNFILNNGFNRCLDDFDIDDMKLLNVVLMMIESRNGDEGYNMLDYFGKCFQCQYRFMPSVYLHYCGFKNGFHVNHFHIYQLKNVHIQDLINQLQELEPTRDIIEYNLHLNLSSLEYKYNYGDNLLKDDINHFQILLEDDKLIVTRKYELLYQISVQYIINNVDLLHLIYPLMVKQRISYSTCCNLISWLLTERLLPEESIRLKEIYDLISKYIVEELDENVIFRIDNNCVLDIHLKRVLSFGMHAINYLNQDLLSHHFNLGRILTVSLRNRTKYKNFFNHLMEIYELTADYNIEMITFYRSDNEDIIY